MERETGFEPATSTLAMLRYPVPATTYVILEEVLPPRKNA
jgi:hypothetical protein